MPELPEVETVCRGLSPHLIDARLAEMVVRRRDLRAPIPARLERALAGKALKGISRRAKYILFHFESEQALIVHLGMSGRLLLHKAFSGDYLKHDHVVMKWTNGYTLIFNDARRFGLMALSPERGLGRHALFESLGPEPLDDAWNGAVLHASLARVGAPIKTAIMDQRRVVGVGNIYACEALFAARLDPRRPACEVTSHEVRRLAQSIKTVLEDAIASGGSTLRDYVRSSGESGYFQHHFNVYGRGKLPCIRCGNPIETIRQSGRSTFFCADCQK